MATTTPAELLATSLSRKHRRKSAAGYQEVLAPATPARPPVWSRVIGFVIFFICLPLYICRTVLNWLRNTIVNWLTMPRELIAGEGQLLEKLEQKVSTLETRLKAVKKQKNKEVRMLRKAVEESPFVKPADAKLVSQPLAAPSAPAAVAAPPPPPPPPFAAPRAAPMPPPPPPPGGKLTLKAAPHRAQTQAKAPALPKPKTAGGPAVTLADITGIKLKKASEAKAAPKPLTQSSNQPLVSLSDLVAIKLKKATVGEARANAADGAAPRINSLRKLEVQRSPGGTPMKSNKENVHSYSATDMVSTALKSSVQRASSILSLRASPVPRSPSHFDS